MKKSFVNLAVFGAMSAAALGLAGTATAVPFGGSNASDAVATLQSQGFSVQINGTVNVPLSRCTVLGVHGLPGPEVAGRQGSPSSGEQGSGTVFVDVDCTH
jgi:hypothetical protein